ncbi:MAG: dihydroorotase [Candidatus ainarchaeum sp.]|nr:dihydroorotase [Candidatus ainarchaeum sp.]
MIIENVKVFLNGKVEEKNLVIENGEIKEIINGSKRGEEKIDGKNLLVLPGLIDPHVHLREPGATHKEDFYTGTRAAVAGGFTTVLDMPNNPKPTITLERLKEKIDLASKKAICDVGFHFGATSDNFKEIRKAKPNSLKIIMGQTTGNLLITDEKTIEKHFINFDKEKPIVIHAEDQEYCEKNKHDGPEAAWLAVEKVSLLAEKIDRRIHIAHTSTVKEIEIAKKWKKCTVESAPHYLFLSKKDYDKLGFRKSVKPCLREEKYRAKFWKNIDKLDCIGSDHAPHTLEEKEGGAYGFPELETSFHLFIDQYSKGNVSLKWITEKMSSSPAKIFNIHKKGEIKKGYFADLIFVDLKKEWVLKEEELETKCKWSPYNGWKFKGKVFGVMNKGKMKYWEYEFLVD